jgi:hypothetical protein
MKYTKPEITSLASASFVIQHATQKDALNQDSTSSTLVTAPAYEGDE